MQCRPKFILIAVLGLGLVSGVVPIQEVAADEPIHGTGDVLQWLIPATGFAATYMHADPEGRRQFLPSMVMALAITAGLKETVREERPNGGAHSFPSGHTSSAFQGASFLQRRYGWQWGIPAYAAAAYTGWSRVELKAHHPHDVFAGAAVGILSSYVFTTPYLKNLEVSAVVETDYVGLSMRTTW